MRMPMAIRRAIYMFNAYRDKSMKTRFATDDDVRYVDNLMLKIALNATIEQAIDVNMQITGDYISPRKVRVVQYTFFGTCTKESANSLQCKYDIIIVFSSGRVIANSYLTSILLFHPQSAAVNSINRAHQFIFSPAAEREKNQFASV